MSQQFQNRILAKTVLCLMVTKARQSKMATLKELIHLMYSLKDGVIEEIKKGNKDTNKIKMKKAKCFIQ